MSEKTGEALSPVCLRPARREDISFLVPSIHEATCGLTLALFGDRGLEQRLLHPTSVTNLTSFTLAIRNTERLGHFSGYDIDIADAEKPGAAIPSEVEHLLQPFRQQRQRGSWYLASLRVVEAFRGLGLGEVLLASALLKARNAGQPTISLHVFSSNELALRLYKRAGFTVVGSSPIALHPDLTASGDVLLMARDVSPR